MAKTIPQLLKELLRAYPNHASRLSAEDIIGMRELWSRHLDDIPPDLLEAAFMAWIQSGSEWLPSISQIRGKVVELTREASTSRQLASEAWEDVRKAMASFGGSRYGNADGYAVRFVGENGDGIGIGIVPSVSNNGQPHFDNPITEQAVQAMGWRELCMSDAPQGVDRGQFMKIYNDIASNLERRAAMHPSIVATISRLSAGKSIPLIEGSRNATSRMVDE